MVSLIGLTVLALAQSDRSVRSSTKGRHIVPHIGNNRLHLNFSSLQGYKHEALRADAS